MIEDARSQSRDDITLDILSILQVLRRRILLIGLVAAVFVIATALYSLRLTPIYSATSQVLFDPLVRQPFDDPNRPSRTSAGTESIDSQISVIHADTVLRPVARDNNLSEDPFSAKGRPAS